MSYDVCVGWVETIALNSIHPSIHMSIHIHTDRSPVPSVHPTQRTQSEMSVGRSNMRACPSIRHIHLICCLVHRLSLRKDARHSQTARTQEHAPIDRVTPVVGTTESQISGIARAALALHLSARSLESSDASRTGSLRESRHSRGESLSARMMIPRNGHTTTNIRSPQLIPLVCLPLLPP